MKINSLFKSTALAVICLLLIIPSLVYVFPFLAGADGSYTVMSGSMSPALKPGDLILVKQIDPSAVEVDDIVTVKSETVFTHRVFEKKFEDGAYLFRTKGDANEDPDPIWWNAPQIMGRTVFVIPLGHLYSPYGYTLSFLVPCVLLVGKQVHHVLSLLKRRSKRELRKWRRQKHPVLDTTGMLLLLILVTSGSWLVAPYFQLGSFSYFSDSEWTSVSFTTGEWVIKAEINIDPDTLNLESEGDWVTCYIELPEGTNVEDIDIATVQMDDVIPAETDPSYGFVENPEIKDRDGDGAPELMVKFDRAEVIEHIRDVLKITDGEVTLTITGQVAGKLFKGSDTIRVMS